MLRKWHLLFLAASPNIFFIAFFIWRGYYVDRSPEAAWITPVLRFMVWPMVLATFLTLFVYPVPKRKIPVVKITSPAIVKPPQSPYRGYSVEEDPHSWLKKLWKKIQKYL